MTVARAVVAAAALIAIGAALADESLGDARGPIIAGAFGILALLAGLHRGGGQDRRDDPPNDEPPTGTR